eukprot:c6959_g1_i1.p1 GENE.c6959_g1_i1~~c6959_g1_i1.p1  ORF type:complete len:198 (+),score=56.17 c6959_g1_i1:42-596(+)
MASEWQDQLQEVLFTKEQLKQGVSDLAKRISTEYAGKNPVLVCVLSGAFLFHADLVRELTIPHEVDFISCSSYGGTASSGSVKLLKDMKIDPTNRHIILVEDIVDTGLTMKTLLDLFKARQIASIALASLLDKPSRRKTDVKADYIAFTVEDKFVVGYGLDFNEQFRSLPHIGVLKPSAYSSSE